MPLRLTSLLFAMSISSDVVAGNLVSDLHLNYLVRTDTETDRIKSVTQPVSDFTKAEPFENNSAGAATRPASDNAKIFKLPSANMDFNRRMDFLLGEALFEKLWVAAPSSNLASDGLGPLYNARSCARCHPNAGRGRPQELGAAPTTSMFLRLSVPGGSPVEEIEGYLADLPEPTYGRQLQSLSVHQHPPEGKIEITYGEIVVNLAGGQTAHLRIPNYNIINLGYGPVDPDIMISPRVAPQMIGLGLLEAIPAQDILALSDPMDEDGNGISGRAQIVLSPEYGEPMLGRFGLKAGSATVYQQSSGAFHADIGISTPLFPDGWGDCTVEQQTCQKAPNGNTMVNDNLELQADATRLVSYYAENLAVPSRRNVDDPQVLQGKKIFYETGCIACHQPKFVTHRLADRPEQSFQLIWPYTDLLLHDMGDGLADHRPEVRASGSEWRTPPLWGIGLTKQVSGHSYFLHDGRARNLLEAVLWHGGEAETAKLAVVAMTQRERDALIRFLESL